MQLHLLSYHVGMKVLEKHRYAKDGVDIEFIPQVKRLIIKTTGVDGSCERSTIEGISHCVVKGCNLKFRGPDKKEGWKITFVMVATTGEKKIE